jgi:hypothetical protein
MDSRAQQTQPAAARPSSPVAREEDDERRKPCECDGKIAACAEHGSLILELL